MSVRRRHLFQLVAAAGLLSGCGDAAPWHEQDVTGVLPPLDFTMTDATNGQVATAADFRGDVVLLTFGYTSCPDLCPTTLTNLAATLAKLGSSAQHVRALFVTVDPTRDTLPQLHAYTAAFAPQIVGLRGTPDQLASLARRYRVAYSVRPGSGDQPPEVTHGTLVYVFDQRGAARLLISSMATSSPDVGGVSADLRRLVGGGGMPGVWRVLAGLV